MLKSEIKVLGWAGLFAVAAMGSMVACGSDDPIAGDDDADDDAPRADGGKKDSGAGKDSGAKDSGTGKDSGTRDSGPRDSGGNDDDASTDADADIPVDGSTDAGPNAVTLTVTRAGAGTGTVTSAPAGINCGATCQASFAPDTEVVLTAAPAAGSTFAGWSGACAGAGTCTVSLDESAAVTATFEPEVLVNHALLLNEMFVDPPGSDNNNEFIELRCAPGLALSPYYLAIVDGDRIDATPTARGKVLFSKRLTGACGASGFVVIQKGSVYDGVAGTTYLNSFFPNNLENGSQTYLLIESIEDLALGNTDLDANDDGIIDDAALQAKVRDSLAMNDGDANDLTYSPAVLTSATFDIHAQARIPGTSTTSRANWYFGSIKAPSPFTYDSTSANFPAGGALTPGAANSGP